MGGALGLWMATILVGLLVYTKPNFCRISVELATQCGGQGNSLSRPTGLFIALVMVVACVLLRSQQKRVSAFFWGEITGQDR